MPEHIVTYLSAAYIRLLGGIKCALYNHPLVGLQYVLTYLCRAFVLLVVLFRENNIPPEIQTKSMSRVSIIVVFIYNSFQVLLWVVY